MRRWMCSEFSLRMRLGRWFRRGCVRWGAQRCWGWVWYWVERRQGMSLRMRCCLFRLSDASLQLKSLSFSRRALIILSICDGAQSWVQRMLATQKTLSKLSLKTCSITFILFIQSNRLIKGLIFSHFRLTLSHLQRSRWACLRKPFLTWKLHSVIIGLVGVWIAKTGH